MRFFSALWLIMIPVALAQTPYSVLAGEVVDAEKGEPIQDFSVTCTNLETGEVRNATTTPSSAFFACALLSPSLYRVVATANDYQDSVIENLALPVAGHFNIRFTMFRLSDPWRSHKTVVFEPCGTVSKFFGPDIDTSRADSFQPAPVDRTFLEASVSYVIDSNFIANLPLPGHDVYSTLALLPAVASDATTGRGLGLSVNGQRPTASNFLLDGLEYNNRLITGPLSILPPELIGEYRVATNNYSVEYGRTAGFVANAVSPPGGKEWHGSGYTEMKNDWLNATGPRPDGAPPGRTPLKDQRFGLLIGGSPARDFSFSAGYQLYRFRSRQDPVQIILPTADFVASIAPDSTAGRLLAGFAAPKVPAGTPITVAPPVDQDRQVFLGRVDRSWDHGATRLFARVTVNRSAVPRFAWSPYPNSVSPLDQNASAGAVSFVRSRGGFF